MKKILNITLGLLFLTLFSACQSNTEILENNNDVPKEVVDHGIPFTNGPDSEPNIKGPDSLPPESNLSEKQANNLVSQAQAITTSESIRLTLPKKTE